MTIVPTSRPATADGTILEGRGVIPDIAVAIDRHDPLAGVDPTLEAALDHLLSSR